MILTKRALTKTTERVSFFAELDMSPPLADIQKAAMRCPTLLFADADVFLRPNSVILREHLGLDQPGVKKLLTFFPSVRATGRAHLHLHLPRAPPPPPLISTACKLHHP